MHAIRRERWKWNFFNDHWIVSFSNFVIFGMYCVLILIVGFSVNVKYCAMSQNVASRWISHIGKQHLHKNVMGVWCAQVFETIYIADENHPGLLHMRNLITGQILPAVSKQYARLICGISNVVMCFSVINISVHVQLRQNFLLCLLVTMCAYIWYFLVINLMNIYA